MESPIKVTHKVNEPYMHINDLIIISYYAYDHYLE